MADFPKTLDFDLQILRAGDSCLANVIASPAGEGRSSFALNYTQEELVQLFRGLGQVRMRTTRGGASPEVRQAQAFGRDLFETVFSGRVRDCFNTSLGVAHAQGAEFRVRLRLDDAELLDLPWELLFDDGNRGFLALDHRIRLIRHLPVQQGIQTLSVDFPLKVLVVMASPKDKGLADIDYVQELRNLKSALKPLIDGGRVELDDLEHANVEGLRHKLKEQDWHVLHFIGHGAYDASNHEGRLVFENTDRSARSVGAGRLGDLLVPHESLRLVVLNACEGARSSRENSFAGVAQTLVQKGIPAVVAMQFPVTDKAAIDLAGEFYRGIAVGLPVERALAAARCEVNLRGEEGDIEWATPVLYMRGEGRLFELDQTSFSKVEIAKATVESTLEPLVELSPRKKQLLDESPIVSEPADIHGEPPPPPPPVKSWKMLLTASGITFVAAIIWNSNDQTPAQVDEPVPAPIPEAATVVKSEVHNPLYRIDESKIQSAPKPSPRPPLSLPRTKVLDGPKPLYKPYRTGEVFQECADCPEMVVIAPDNPFTIGSPKGEDGRDSDEGPFGPIRFAAPYAVGRFEVTRAQFARSGVVAGKGCYSWSGSGWEPQDDADWRDPKFPGGLKQADDDPVVCVDWNTAQSFAKWLDTRQSGGPANAYRLPSEAEWEYSARGGTKGTWFWGPNADDACAYANVADRSLTTQVAGWTTFGCRDGHVLGAPGGGGQVGEGYRFKANAFGLYDMLGNVLEWTQDCYQASYDRAIREGRAYELKGSCDGRVVRGGSWTGGPGDVRSANRLRSPPGIRFGSLGFRVARTLP